MALPGGGRAARADNAERGPSIRALLRLREYRLLIIIAALVLGSNAMEIHCDDPLESGRNIAANRQPVVV